jgi:hypothetical protein
MATIYVKKDGSGNALTIQQGIQLAAIGDIVDIEAGTFDENVDLWKGITLQGAGIGSTIITGATRSAITARTFTWTLGSTTLNVAAGADISAYEVGRVVTATGIPANARIVSKTSTSLTISAATTQAATTARAVNMTLQNDATLRVRGGPGVIKNMKVVGFDNPNPASEFAALFFKNTGQGTNFANGWEVFNCEFVAAGEYALLTDSGSGLGNFNIHDCKFSGQTFVGANPAVGNQFSVWNVPRQLITIQGVNSGLNKFQNNEVTGLTGGLTIDGIPSYNTAITIDPVGSIISGNTIDVESGTGYGLRARGLNSTVEDNYNLGTTAGYYILPNLSTGVLIPVGTMIANSSKYWVCIQEHTSATNNAPTGIDGALFWSEITLTQVNESGVYGVGLQVIDTNSNELAALVELLQENAGDPIQLSYDSGMLKAIPSVSGSATFSNEANWYLVGFIFKHTASSKRLYVGIKNQLTSKAMLLRSGLSSESYELDKVILSTSDRTLLAVQRNEIEDVENYDITLK